MKNTKSFLHGVLVTLLILAIGGTVFASNLAKEATLHYAEIKITFDGKGITPKDATGAVVEPFIIDGTTYLPVRAIAEALSLDVNWDGATNTVVLTTPIDAVNCELTRIVDGDTLIVNYNNVSERVRLIGVDTPESVHPDVAKNTAFGKMSTEFTTEYLIGKEITLEFDVSQRDHYGRFLVYVWIGDELYNETLVKAGYAMVSTYPPNIKYVERFTAAQTQARAAKAGLWADEYIGTGNVPPDLGVDTVYITPTGKRYHALDTCAGKNATPVSIESVGTLTPCETCIQK